MTVGVHVDGLLHLSAITLVGTAAYIGLDRVRRAPDRFKDQLATVESRVKDMLLQLDVMEGNGLKLKDIFNRAPVHILCHVAGVKVELGALRRLLHAVHRQWYVPILGYFRRRADLIIVGIFCLISFVVFLALTAASVWDLPDFALFGVTIDMPHAAEYTYILLSFMLLWIFFTVALSYRLQQIDNICLNLEGQVENYVRGIYRQAFDFVNKKAPPRRPQSPQPPQSQQGPHPPELPEK